MDRFVVRAPTWKTLEMSSFSSSFANVSLTGKRSTPKAKEEKSKAQSNRRLSIRDESLMKIFTSQPDEPLMVARSQDLSPFAVRYNGSFGSNAPAVTREKYSQQSLRLASNDENTPPPNARITLSDEPAVGIMCSSGENSNSRPSTPIVNMIPANLGSCTPKDNPFLARIQRDLNSPSAAIRVRALKALKSPTKSAYANFDIPHEEQDIITEEERKSPVKVKSIQELMKDVVVYVEVRTGEDNRSSGVKQVISALGAKVNDKLLRDTTHVVFKDGLLSTYNKAKKWNIPIVSILWIEACKKQMKLMSPKDFPISNPDRYENPELYDKMKRYKSMQPDAEENRRQRAKAPTKENGIKSKVAPATPSNSNATKKKTDITRFFTQMDKVKGTPSNSSSTESPSTQLLNRMTDNLGKTSSDSLIKLAYLDSVSNLSDTAELTPKSGGVKKMLVFGKNEEEEASSSATKTPIRRRNSIQVTQTPQKVNQNLAEAESSNNSATPGVRTRRRSSIHIPTNMSIAEKGNDKSSKKPFSTISEKIIEEPELEAVARQSTFAEKSMDITKNTPNTKKTQSTRRRTLYTPKPMEETNAHATKATSSVNRRRTIFATTPKTSETHTMEMSSVAPVTPFSGGIPSSTVIGEESVKTPVQFSSLLEEHASATIFSSTKPATNPRRRTLFDVSMDIISQRLQNINQSAKSSRTRPDDLQIHDRRSSQDNSESISELLTPTDDSNKTIRKELFSGNYDSAQKPESTIGNTPSQASAAPSTPVEVVTKKKRKLFVPNDILLTPTPQSSTDSEDISVASKRTPNTDITSLSTQATAKRRRTIMPTLTQSKPEQKKPPTKANGTTAHSSRRSTMDFEAIKKAKSVINKKSAAAALPTKDATNNASKPKPYQFLVYTNMHTEQIEFIKEAISTLEGFQLEDKVSDNTTHIVSLEPRRTFNLLHGLVRGLWILNYNWILDSVKAGNWLNEEQYELREFSRAVEICRSERQAFGNGYKMDLFSDVGPIYIASVCSIPRNNLKELITLCAGRIADRRKRAKYIIGDSSPEILPGKIYLEPQWILDSISHRQIQKLTKYIVTTTTEEK